jgi:iron complex outermembrane receptor protein
MPRAAPYIILYVINTVPIDRASHVTTSVGAFGQATYTPPIANDALHLTAARASPRQEGRPALHRQRRHPTVNGVTAPQLNAAWSRVDPMVNLART